MKPTHLITTLLGCAGMFSVAHAGGLNPANVSGDAKWLLHYDADAAKSSGVGKHALDKMSDIDERRLRAIKRLISINPVEDFKSVTLYGTSARHEDAILVVRVDHDADHVADLIAACPVYKSKTIGNQVIHQFECRSGHKVNIVLLDDAYLIAAGTEGAVRRGAALVQGRGKSMKGSPIAAAVSKGSPIFAAWANLERLEMKSRSKMTKEVKSMRYWLGEKGDDIGWHMSLEMKGEDTAKMVQKMAEGMLEYAKKQKKAEHELIQKAMAAIDSKVEGSTVHMWAFYDSGDVIDVMEMMEKKMKEYKASGKRGCPLGYGRGGSKGWHGHHHGHKDGKEGCCGKCGGDKKEGAKDGCCGKCGGEKKEGASCPKGDKEGCKGCDKADCPKGGAEKKESAKCPKGDKKEDKGDEKPRHHGKGGDHDRDHRHHGKDDDRGHHHRGKTDDDDDDDDKRRGHRKPTRRT